MSTTNTTETGILKALALMQFNNESFFKVNNTYYEGNEQEAIDEHKEEMEQEEQTENGTIQTFEDWCIYNKSEVEAIEDDEERNGYIVLTDDEADEKAGEYIKDSLWAFNASFIIEHSKLPYEAEEMVSSFQSDKCESANETIEALIDDIDEFIKDAISADGRGHFMSSYDGNENEETIEGETFYIYRIN